MSVAYHGERFAGYQLVELIGWTALTTVHRAIDAEGNIIALKILNSHVDDFARLRFLRDSEAARELHHPHIVPIIETGEADGRLYVAMRHMAEGDVAAILARDEHVDAGRAVALLTEVALALDTAHRRSLVHGDVKPSNIHVETVDGVEHAYLSGFGAAAGAGPEYAAPEQVEGGRVDGRSDVYSLARVLQSCVASVPRSLDEVLARAQAHRKEDRYATATDLMTAAAAALSARPAPPRPAWPWSPLVVAAASAAALAAAAGVAFGIHSHAAPSSSPASASVATPAAPGLLAPGNPTAAATPAATPAAAPPPSTDATPAATPAPTAAATAPPTQTSVVHIPSQAPVVSPPLSGNNLFYATVRNTGTTELVAGASSLSSGAAAAIVNDGCAGAHIVPGGSCQVTIRFLPAALRGVTTVLSVPLSDGQPVTFTLHGTG